MKMRISQAVVAYCILGLAAAVYFKASLDKNQGETSNYVRYSSQEPLVSEEVPQIDTAQGEKEASYDPFSRKFRFRSLYEIVPDVDYESLADDLAVFVPEADQDHLKIPLLREHLISSIVNNQTAEDGYTELISNANIFRKLQLYENFINDSTPVVKHRVTKNEHYCDEVDVLNLIHPENLFHHYTIVDTYFQRSVRKMLESISNTYYIPNVIMKFNETFQLQTLRPNASVIFGLDLGYDILRNVGVNFSCITQSYASLKGTLEISTKHNMVTYFEQYRQRNLPKTCINYDVFFPSSYRLSDEEECRRFFNILNSQEYAAAKQKMPVQYLMKVGAESHQGKGVEVLDEKLEAEITLTYASGSLCGIVNEDMIAQKYIANPLLIYDRQKFDFRVYVLIASMNPLIAYYRDGFVRVSLQKYDAQTSEKKSHLTNSHLSDEIIKNATTKAEKKKLLSMQLSTFQMLADDLESKGKLHGERGKREFIEYLRKKFKTAIAHILRFTRHVFEERSGSFRIMGFDFMLDEDMNLWFIEANHGPQLTQTEPRRRYFTEILVRDALEIEFALLRSRVKRVLKFVHKAANEYRLKREGWDEDGLRRLFKEANKEKFEPEFKISSTNTWEKIIDFTLAENEESGYLGNLDRSCFQQ